MILNQSCDPDHVILNQFMWSGPCDLKPIHVFRTIWS